MSNVKQDLARSFETISKSCEVFGFHRAVFKMEFRLRARHEQFTIMLDFMETNGDLSRLQQGAQGRLRAERLWNELTELLNSVGGSGVRKPVEKWKRVWSDWKTKIKKKASIINRDTHGTGGGPSRARPLNPLEERVLRIIGVGSITGHEEVQEAGFEVQSQEPLVRIQSPSQPAQLSPPAVEVELSASTSQTLEIPHISEPLNIEMSNVASASTHHAVPVTSNTGRREDAQRSPSAGPSTPRRRRLFGQRRRRHQTPFEQATSEFVRVEDGRLRLEEMRILKQHERDMEQLRVESQRNEILQKIADTANNIMELLSQSRLVRD